MPNVNIWGGLQDQMLQGLGPQGGNKFANMPPVNLMPLMPQSQPTPGLPPAAANLPAAQPAAFLAPPPQQRAPVPTVPKGSMPPPLAEIDAPPTPTTPTPSVQDYMKMLNEAGTSGLKDQRANIEELKTKLKNVDLEELPIDLRPAAALVDSWTGSHLAQYATPSETQKDRDAMKEKLQEQIMKHTQGMSGSEIDQLKTQLTNQLGLDSLANKKEEDAYKKTQDVIHNKFEQQKIGAEYAKIAAMQSKQGDQGPLTKGQEELDKKFADEYKDFISTGGYAQAQKGLEQIGLAKSKLAQNPGLTGGAYNFIPDKALNLVSPETVSLRDNVRDVITHNMKQLLGSQFTEKEGERVLNLAFNPGLPAAENMQRLGRLQTQMQKAFEAKQQSADYFRQHGTLKGFDGKTNFSLSDFETGGGSGSSSAPSGSDHSLEDLLREKKAREGK